MALRQVSTYNRTPGIAPAGAPAMGQPPAVPQAGMPQPQGAIPVPPGPLVQYYSDLAGGAIAPEDMRIEDLQFRVQISPTGQIVYESPKVSLVSRYNFALRRIVGFAMDPVLGGPAPFLVGVQVREEGRNFEIFKRPISMSSLLRNSEGVAAWDGVYITIPGTDMSVVWSVDIARWAALVGAAREFGVQLMGDYVACAP